LKAFLKGILCALADVFWWKAAGFSCSVILFLDFLWCVFVNTVLFFGEGDAWKSTRLQSVEDEILT